MTASRTASLPFVLVRQHQVIGSEIMTTTDEIHGLLYFEGELLRVQWRLSRATERIGAVIRKDVELQPVGESSVPLAALAGAEVRQRGWRRWLGRAELELAIAERALASAPERLSEG